MDDREAAEFTEFVKPKVAAIPMHYGVIVGSALQAQAFVDKTKP